METKHHAEANTYFPKGTEALMMGGQMPQWLRAGKPLNTGLEPTTTQFCESLEMPIVLRTIQIMRK